MFPLFLKHRTGYILHNQKYDVWLGNARGNIYSRNHTKNNPSGWRQERKKFWNFSFHEIGKYDLPASIDYILDESNYTQVNYIGHSQGTTSFFVMMSERPEYNEKVSMMIALAPVAYVDNVDNEVLNLVLRNLNTIEVSFTCMPFLSLNHLIV